MSDDLRFVSATPGRIDPERLAHALARADLKAKLFGAPQDSARVGRFSVLRRVGAGSLGVVYAAYDEQLDRRIALKLLHVADPAAAARFKREAQALTGLAHPHVVRVHEVGEARGQVYVAMEFVQGETLRAWQERQPRSWREIVAMYVQAGRGLAAAHAAGVVHREFKAEDVLVGEDGRARVVDFGLACARASAAGELEETGRNRHASSEDVERTGEGAARRSANGEPGAPSRDIASSSLAGPSASAAAWTTISSPHLAGLSAADLTVSGVRAPASFAPEQHAGGEADARSDVFCFCSALHEALHGTRPFVGERREDVYAAILAGAITRGERDVPAWVQRALERGLAADPAARWPSMDALLHALGRDPARLLLRLALALALVTAAVALGLALARPSAEDGGVGEVAREQAASTTSAAPEPSRASGEARRLAAAAEHAGDPALRLLLAVEAVQAARERGEAPPPEAEQALLDALDGPRSEVFARPGAAIVDVVAESHDGRWLATGERTGAVALWSTAEPGAPRSVSEGTGAVAGLAFAADRDLLAVARADDRPRVLAIGGDGGLEEYVSWDISLADPRDLAWGAGEALVVRDGPRVLVLRPRQAPQVLGEGGPALRRALWSPDGATLLTLDGEGGAQLWPASGGPARALRLPAPAAKGARGLLAAAWRGDGAEIVVARADHTAAIVPVRGGAARRLVGHTDEVYGAAFLPDGRAVTVSRDGSARVWQRDGSSARVELEGHDEALLGVQIGPARDLLLGTPAGGEVWLWQLDVGGPPARLRGHTGSVVAAGFSQGGARVLSASIDGSARRWRIADDPWLLRGHPAGIEQAAFLADARAVVTAGPGGTAWLWPRDGRPSFRLGGHREGSALVLAPSPDGRRLLTAGSDGGLRVWSWTGEGPVLEASLERGAAVLAAGWSPAADLAAIAGEDGRVALVRLAPGEPPSLSELTAHVGPVRALHFTPDGLSLASAGDEGLVRVNALAGGPAPANGDVSKDSRDEADARADAPGLEVRLRGHAGPVRALAVDLAGARLASAGDDAVARVWSLARPDAAPLELRGHAGPIRQIHLRPDGGAALTASADGTAIEWSLDDGEPVVLRGHTDAVTVAVYSPDGAAILTASADGTALLWSRAGEGLVPLRLPHSPAPSPGEPRGLRTGGFSPDGRLLVTAGADGLGRVFPATVAGRLAAACARAGRDLNAEEWRRFLGDRPYRRTCSVEHEP